MIRIAGRPAILAFLCVTSLLLSFFPALAGDIATSPGVNVEPGAYRTYRFTYQDENTTTLFPDRLGQSGGQSGTFMSALTFDGDLRVKAYGRSGGETIYSLSFDNIHSNHFALNGHDLFDRPEQFIGKYKKNEVYVSLNGENEITRFYFPENTTQVFKTFMTTVALEIQVSLRQGKTNWKTREINQHGAGIVDYSVTGKQGNRIELKKSRKNYDYPGLISPEDKQSVHTDEKITISGNGWLENIDKREETEILSKEGKSTILKIRKTLRLKQIRHGMFDPGGFDRSQLGSMQSVYPGESIPDKDQRRKLLAKQAAYLSYDDIETWIDGFKPDKNNNRANNAMFYRSIGFVSLQPRSTEKLADYCINKAKESQSKVLTMNLLAAVGTPGAQNAMRRILSDSGIIAERYYGVMIQNFSLMDQKPEPQTLKFLEGLIRGQENHVSYAAAHAFGACIHKLYKGNDTENALALNRILLDKMKTAKSPLEKAEYIAAVGNAGIVENNVLLFDYLQNENTRLRTEAVMALRKTETHAVREQVLNLFQDSERSVQRSAIQTYLHFSPTENNLRVLLHQLGSNLIQEANYYDLTTLLKKNQARYPELVRQCLKMMIRKKLKDPDLEARIRQMI